MKNNNILKTKRDKHHQHPLVCACIKHLVKSPLNAFSIVNIPFSAVPLHRPRVDQNICLSP